jgi:hypothetical protein
MRHSHFPDRLQAPQLTLKLSPEDELRDGGLGEGNFGSAKGEHGGDAGGGRGERGGEMVG